MKNKAKHSKRVIGAPNCNKEKNWNQTQRKNGLLGIQYIKLISFIIICIWRRYVKKLRRI